MEKVQFNDLKGQINFFGEFSDRALEKEFINFQWSERKLYYLVSYFTCTILFFFHGFFDYKRDLVVGSPNILMGVRLLFLVFCSFFVFRFRKVKQPRFLYEYCFSLQLFSILIIFLLTVFTGGMSATLPIGVMIMYASFYIMLPGRPIYALLSSLFITCIYLFLGDRTNENYFIFSFIIISSNIILWVFCRNQNRYQRLEYISFLNFNELVDMKTKLLNVLAHDIRSPLQIIIMRSGVGKNGFLKGNYERIEEHFDSVKDNAYKIEGLVKDLLNWTLESKSEDLTKSRKKRDLNETLDVAIDYVKEAADLKSINIEKSFTSLKFNHDSIMMETVFRNLLSNSIKFSNEGSTVKIYTEVNLDKLELIIEDHGGQISEEQILKIRDGRSFSTVGTKGEQGFGMGLRLVRSFLNYHKIEFNITSSDKSNRFILGLRVQ